MNEALLNALEECLVQVEAGASVEDALARHPRHRADLAPLLGVALAARATRAVEPSTRAAMHDRLVALARDVYPPTQPPKPGSARVGGRGALSGNGFGALAVAMFVALSAAGLVASRLAPVSPPSEAAPAQAAQPAPPRDAAAPPDARMSPLAAATRATDPPRSRASPSPPGSRPTSPAGPTGTTPAASPPASAGVAAAPRPGGEQGEVRGRVIDDNGHALASALVSAESVAGGGGVTAKTRSDGTYQLSLPAGSYRLVAQASGFQEQWYPAAATRQAAGELRVAAGAVAGAEFVLARLESSGGYPPPEPTAVPSPSPPPTDSGYPPPMPPTAQPPYP